MVTPVSFKCADAPQTLGQIFDGVDYGPEMLRKDGLEGSKQKKKNVSVCSRYF